MLWFIKKVNSYFLRSLDSSLFFRKWIFLHKGVGGRGMGGFRRITWFLISGKMEGGIICRRQSIKGGGLQKIDRQSNAHNKMGEGV